MKKIVISVLAVIMCAAVFSCGGKNSESSSKPESKVTYEDAFEDCFYSMYDNSRIDDFYLYILPKAALDELKENGKYEQYFAPAHYHGGETQAEVNAVIEEVLRKVELTDNQLKAAENYLLRISKGYGAELSSIEVTEGWQIDYRFSVDGQEATMSECYVYVKDDGWKRITMEAEMLETFA